MRIALLLVPVALLIAACGGDSATPPAATAAPADLAGSYAVTGTNPNGSSYEGTLDVVRHGEVFQFSWASGESYEGIGMQDGDVVGVGWGAQGCGVVAYRVGDGVLKGRWAIYGDEAIGTERATRSDDSSASAGSVVGTYDVAGANPDGSPYIATLSVAKAGPAYRLTWTSGETSVGQGFLEGDVLATSYGGEGCAVAVYRASGTVLDGRWATLGTNETGTEQATRL